MDHGHCFTILDLHWFFISRCSKILWCQVVLKCKHEHTQPKRWAISLYYWPCSYTCETGLQFVPIPYKSFLLLSFSLHKSWRKVSCMAIHVQISCLAIKNDTKLQKLALHLILCKYFLKQQMNGLIKLLYKHVFLFQQYFCIDSFQPKYFCFMIFWADSSSNLLFNFFFK